MYAHFQRSRIQGEVTAAGAVLRLDPPPSGARSTAEMRV
jgi:hypothetical protein